MPDPAAESAACLSCPPGSRRGLMLAASMLLSACGGLQAVQESPGPGPAPSAASGEAVVAAMQAAASAVRAAPGPAPREAPEPAPSVPVDPPAPQLLLQWHDELRQLPGDALQREIGRLGDAAAPGAAPGPAMRLALALTSTRNPADLPRAIALLEQLQRSSHADAPAWRGWARLLGARLQEQRRADEAVERLSLQLRDSQRRIDQLNDKLEALKAIERSLTMPRPATSGNGR
ncbi:hypothetical protein C7444_101377 [Sphaerotilus hippei]|uniref:YfhG lipoprotein n=2 Tax=Sphaerotilus hippei TaxID=744406 RepID=A0A318H6D4_9BURK|nr:hypothetical protein C7444_101377 [Sphaerotilus hippei]